MAYPTTCIILELIGLWDTIKKTWVRYPAWQQTFVSPSAFPRRTVVSYWRKYVHEVLVNRLGGLSLPRKSGVRLTDRPDMTLDVYHGRKTTMQQQHIHNYITEPYTSKRQGLPLKKRICSHISIFRFLKSVSYCRERLNQNGAPPKSVPSHLKKYEYTTIFTRRNNFCDFLLAFHGPYRPCKTKSTLK